MMILLLADNIQTAVSYCEKDHLSPAHASMRTVILTQQIIKFICINQIKIAGNRLFHPSKASEYHSSSFV